MIQNYEFIYKISEEQLEKLMVLFKNVHWAKDRQKSDVIKMLEKSNVIALINTDNGDIVAFSRVISDFVYRAFIYDVMVAEKYRGQGYGKLIVNSLFNHYNLNPVERVELNCIDKNVAFYEKLGFKKVPEGTNMMRYNG